MGSFSPRFGLDFCRLASWRSLVLCSFHARPWRGVGAFTKLPVISNLRMRRLCGGLLVFVKSSWGASFLCLRVGPLKSTVTKFASCSRRLTFLPATFWFKSSWQTASLPTPHGTTGLSVLLPSLSFPGKKSSKCVPPPDRVTNSPRFCVGKIRHPMCPCDLFRGRKGCSKNEKNPN